MNYFGTWYVTNHPTDKDLWILHNPVTGEIWGVRLDEGQQVVPCDKFVFDMASTKLVRAIWPQHWARRASTHHDWGHHVHKTPEDELMIEMKEWFDSLGWNEDCRRAYIRWLKSRTQADWDRDFYILAQMDGVWKPLAWFGWKTLKLVGFIAWNRERTGNTQIYREQKEVTP